MFFVAYLAMWASWRWALTLFQSLGKGGLVEATLRGRCCCSAAQLIVPNLAWSQTIGVVGSVITDGLLALIAVAPTWCARAADGNKCVARIGRDRGGEVAGM